MFPTLKWYFFAQGLAIFLLLSGCATVVKSNYEDAGRLIGECEWERAPQKPGEVGMVCNDYSENTLVQGYELCPLGWHDKFVAGVNSKGASSNNEQVRSGICVHNTTTITGTDGTTLTHTPYETVESRQCNAGQGCRKLIRYEQCLWDEEYVYYADMYGEAASWYPCEKPYFQEAMANLSGINFSQSSPQPLKEQTPLPGSGSGFFVSKMGHVITNAHVVHNCNKVTIGDNTNKQVPAEIINTDQTNDLALLKLSTLEMASAESKSLIQKLGIVVVPLSTSGLLRSEDVKLGEKVLVAGYPFGEYFSNTIKVTGGLVSATRGAGDDSGQFQLDAAVQPGNSGGPIYDSSGNIVGVVISQLDKLKVAKAVGSLPENVNFGIKASTVRQFLISSGVPSKKSKQTEEKSSEQLAAIAQNQALMVMCLQ